MPIQKRSSILSSLGIGGGVHIAQNAIVNELLRSPEKTGNMVNKLIMRGMLKPNEAMPSIADSVSYGSLSAFLPELNIIHREASHIGEKFREKLKNIGTIKSRPYIFLSLSPKN